MWTFSVTSGRGKSDTEQRAVHWATLTATLLITVMGGGEHDMIRKSGSTSKTGIVWTSESFLLRQRVPVYTISRFVQNPHNLLSLLRYRSYPFQNTAKQTHDSFVDPGVARWSKLRLLRKDPDVSKTCSHIRHSSQ